MSIETQTSKEKIEIYPWMTPEEVVQRFFIDKSINSWAYPWYLCMGSKIKPYQWSKYPPPDNKKWETYDYEKPNIWWKIRVNTSPQNVWFISQYLISKWYKHKYESGGTISGGTQFTIYIWSYSLTHKCAKSIENDLSDKILDPIATQDIRITKKISWRFNIQNSQLIFEEEWWSDYWRFWFPNNLWIQLEPPKRLYLVPSFIRIWKHYGKYFFDAQVHQNQEWETWIWFPLRETEKRVIQIVWNKV